MKAMRIALADDHRLFRSIVKRFLDGQDDMEVKAEAGNGLELLEKMTRQKIDLVLTDIQMPDFDGFELTRILKRDYKDVKVMGLSMFGHIYHIQKLVDTGASGYILKTAVPEDMVHCLRRAMDEERVFCKETTDLLLRSALHKSGHAPDFGERDIQILELLLRDKNDEEVARVLDLTVRRLQTLIQDIMVQTGVKTRGGLVRWVMDHGLGKGSLVPLP